MHRIPALFSALTLSGAKTLYFFRATLSSIKVILCLHRVWSWAKGRLCLGTPFSIFSLRSWHLSWWAPEKWGMYSLWSLISQSSTRSVMFPSWIHFSSHTPSSSIPEELNRCRGTGNFDQTHHVSYQIDCLAFEIQNSKADYFLLCFPLSELAIP